MEGIQKYARYPTGYGKSASDYWGPVALKGVRIETKSATIHYQLKNLLRISFHLESHISNGQQSLGIPSYNKIAPGHYCGLLSIWIYMYMILECLVFSTISKCACSVQRLIQCILQFWLHGLNTLVLVVLTSRSAMMELFWLCNNSSIIIFWI